MEIQDFVGKRVELLKRFVCNLNTFKAGTRMRVVSVYRDREGLVLKDRMRPDIHLVLGPGELQHMKILHENAKCYSCGMEVVSKDGKNCPECGKVLWELIARHPKEK